MFKRFIKGKRASTAGVLVALVLAIILFIVTMNVVGGIVNRATEYQVQTNETWNTTTGWVYAQLANISLVNDTAYVGNSTFTATRYLDYLINNTDGTLLANTSADGDGVRTATGLENNTEYNVSYKWTHGSYLSDSTQRLLAKLIPTILSIGLFVIVVKFIEF